jgi:D-alanyl-D-alanine carboxypeptidase/D-alanyl-D-alanine-endopeptidase (penicillin-binding protein 4)
MAISITALRAAVLLLAIGAPSALAGQEQSLQQRIETRLGATGEVGPGTRFGLVVATQDGRELVAIAPDERFIPASNTKMFTTAAAFQTLPALDRPDVQGGTSVRLESHGAGAPDVVLKGHGDARLSSAP